MGHFKNIGFSQIAFVLLLNLPLFGLLIWNSESFQQKYFPEKYRSAKIKRLENQITELEQKITIDKHMLYGNILDFERMRLTLGIERMQDFNDLNLPGIKELPSELQRDYINLRESERAIELQALINTIKMLRDGIENDTKELTKLRGELAQWQWKVVEERPLTEEEKRKLLKSAP